MDGAHVRLFSFCHNVLDNCECMLIWLLVVA